MRTTFDIDESLLQEALSLSATPSQTKKGVIVDALNEYVQNRKRKNLLDLAGKIEFDDGYDYKAMRKNKEVAL